VEPLEWDPVIADVMVAHGERCWYAHSDSSKRDYVSAGSPLDEDGNPLPMYHTENIAASTSSDHTCNKVDSKINSLFNIWNKESAYYNCIENKPNDGYVSHDYAHWAVLTWASTKYIGCSMICGCEDFLDEHKNKPWSYMFFCQYAGGGGLDGSRPFSLESCLEYDDDGDDDDSTQVSFASNDIIISLLQYLNIFF